MSVYVLVDADGKRLAPPASTPAALAPLLAATPGATIKPITLPPAGTLYRWNRATGTAEPITPATPRADRMAALRTARAADVTAPSAATLATVVRAMADLLMGDA